MTEPPCSHPAARIIETRRRKTIGVYRRWKCPDCDETWAQTNGPDPAVPPNPRSVRAASWPLLRYKVLVLYSSAPNPTRVEMTYRELAHKFGLRDAASDVASIRNAVAALRKEGWLVHRPAPRKGAARLVVAGPTLLSELGYD